MSTAGKVLVVLVMLVSVACLILAGGVAQLHYNANQRLDKLDADLQKAQASVDSTRQEVASYRDQTTIAQEKIDREVASLLSRQTDLERSRSHISNTLSKLQADMKLVDDTIVAAKESLRIRVAEFEADTAAMADLRRNVDSLKAGNSERMGRLQSLRQRFQDTYHDNVEKLGSRR